ncbi:hypothetical protein LTR86_006111 [Recurvomyces mirabilis]|nr:hypothetical protein LTR86_006111 [Recurvomyces mirabilis]
MADFNDNFMNFTPMDNYVITRIVPGQAYDPTSPPVFYPAKDSDELFDALRTAFPHVKSHPERMRDAMIQFLMEERQAEQMQPAFAPTAATTPATFQQTWPSMSSSGTSSTWSSPETMDLATPTFGMSPGPMAPPPLARQYSTAPSMAAPSITGSSSPAAIEDMTTVFSISTTGQPKQRVRRRMTEAEKAEYRKRRIAKACDSCSRRKRKCTHNQPEMETLASKQKVTKPRQAAAAATNQNMQQALVNFDDLDFGDPFATDMQLFDDFTNDLEDPLHYMQYDEQKKFDHLLGSATNNVNDHQYQFDGQPDWATNRSSSGEFATYAFGTCETDDRADWGVPDTPQHEIEHAHARARATNAAQLQDVNAQIEADHLRSDFHPHRLFSTINTRSSPQSSSGSGGPSPSGNRMLWEHLRTGQIEPTHTAHLHEALSAALVNEDTGGSETGHSIRRQERTSWASSVLAVTGTAKAVRAFGRVLQSNGPTRISLQLIRMSSVISTVAHSRQPADNGGSMATSQTSNPQGYFGLKQNLLNKFSALDAKDPIADAGKQQREGYKASRASPALSSDEQVLRGSGMEMASTSVSLNQGGSLFNKESPAHNEGRPAFTLGEGIERAASPSTELYMLKRRIPRTLQSAASSGGAYQRLGTDNYARPIPGDRDPGLSTTSRQLLVANADQDTMFKNLHNYFVADTAPPGNSSGGNLSRLDVWANPGPAAHIAAQPEASTPRRELVTYVRSSSATDGQGRAVVAASPQLQQRAQSVESTLTRVDDVDIVYVHKKRDTFRRRDHFGRVQQEQDGREARVRQTYASEPSAEGGLGSVLAVVGGVLMLATASSMLSASAVDPSLLLLALLLPAKGTRGTKALARCWAHYSHVYGTMLENIKACYLVLVLETLALFTGTRYWQEVPTCDRMHEGRSGKESGSGKSDGAMAHRWGRCGGAFPRFWDALVC